LTSILDGTSSPRPGGWAQDNGEQAIGEKILIKDGVVVVVAGSETGQPGSLLVLKRRLATVECSEAGSKPWCGTYM
jgi:hypothetical protein